MQNLSIYNRFDPTEKIVFKKTVVKKTPELYDKNRLPVLSTPSEASLVQNKIVQNIAGNDASIAQQRAYDEIGFVPQVSDSSITPALGSITGTKKEFSQIKEKVKDTNTIVIPLSRSARRVFNRNFNAVAFLNSDGVLSESQLEIINKSHLVDYFRARNLRQPVAQRVLLTGNREHFVNSYAEKFIDNNAHIL